jgi:hypothetical protein
MKKTQKLTLDFERTYGDDKTQLTLTDKAFYVYSNSDNIRIIEEHYSLDDGEYFPNDDHHLIYYRIEEKSSREVLTSSPLTESEVNEWFEQDFFED